MIKNKEENEEKISKHLMLLFNHNFYIKLNNDVTNFKTSHVIV